jgi:hypothetical protein
MQHRAVQRWISKWCVANRHAFALGVMTVLLIAVAVSDDAPTFAVVGVPASPVSAQVSAPDVRPRVQLASSAAPDPALWQATDQPRIDAVPLYVDAPADLPVTETPGLALTNSPVSRPGDLAQAVRILRQQGAPAAVLGEAGLCLAEAVYFESRGQPLVGQLAVAQVILNRAADKRFASTVCGVVRERSKSGACQFSFVCDTRSDVPGPSAAWDEARAIAQLAMSGSPPDVTGGRALFFHAVHVAPPWRLRMARTATLGTHMFYRPR